MQHRLLDRRRAFTADVSYEGVSKVTDEIHWRFTFYDLWGTQKGSQFWNPYSEDIQRQDKSTSVSIKSRRWIPIIQARDPLNARSVNQSECDQFSSVDPWLKQKPTRCGPKSPRSPREVIRQSLNAFDWTLSDPRSPKSSGSSGYRTPLSALSQITEIDEMSYK